MRVAVEHGVIALLRGAQRELWKITAFAVEKQPEQPLQSIGVAIRQSSCEPVRMFLEAPAYQITVVSDALALLSVRA
jgi:hypothetical protein